VDDLLAGEALADLLHHPAAQHDHLLQLSNCPVGSPSRTTAETCRRLGLGEQAPGLAQRRLCQLGDLLGERCTSCLASPARRATARFSSRVRLPAARLRSRTLLLRPGIAAWTLRATRARTLTTSAASPLSVGKRMSDSCTVESQRMALTLKPRSRIASRT